MTVKDILKLVCEFVGEKEIFAKLEETESALTKREQEKVDDMVRCFNLVNEEIASDYLPYLTKEEISVKNSVLNYSSLSKKVVHVYEVKNRFGLNLRFKLFPEFVEIFGNAKTIVYSFLPKQLSLGDEVEAFSGLTARIFAYGVASEYLLMNGLDCEVWDERFKQSLFMLTRKMGQHILPTRRWL